MARGGVPPPVASPPKSPRLGLLPRAGRVAVVSASQTRQRAKVLQVRLTPDESAAIEAKAHTTGLSLSGYARQTLLGEPTQRTRRAKPSPDVQALAILLGQLGKAGSNLNQLARLGNRGQPIPLPELMETLAAVRAAAEKVRQALK